MEGLKDDRRRTFSSRVTIPPPPTPLPFPHPPPRSAQNKRPALCPPLPPLLPPRLPSYLSSSRSLSFSVCLSICLLPCYCHWSLFLFSICLSSTLVTLCLAISLSGLLGFFLPPSPTHSFLSLVVRFLCLSLFLFLHLSVYLCLCLSG